MKRRRTSHDRSWMPIADSRVLCKAAPQTPSGPEGSSGSGFPLCHRVAWLSAMGIPGKVKSQKDKGKIFEDMIFTFTLLLLP